MSKPSKFTDNKLQGFSKSLDSLEGRNSGTNQSEQQLQPFHNSCRSSNLTTIKVIKEIAHLKLKQPGLVSIFPYADDLLLTSLDPVIPHPPTLLGIPPEIHLSLFKHLDVVTSICMGLTCKTLYKIQQSIHGIGRFYRGCPKRKPLRPICVAEGCTYWLVDLIIAFCSLSKPHAPRIQPSTHLSTLKMDQEPCLLKFNNAGFYHLARVGYLNFWKKVDDLNDGICIGLESMEVA